MAVDRGLLLGLGLVAGVGLIAGAASGGVAAPVPPPGAPMPKSRGAPFCPVPDGARVWPVAGGRRRLSYLKASGGYEGNAARAFGASRPAAEGCSIRKHGGMDLYGGNYPVRAIADGVIVAGQGWAGPNAKAFLIDHGPFVALYGAVVPNGLAQHGLKVGDSVQAGQVISRIGTYPGGSTMLHFETYVKGTRKNYRWCGSSPPSVFLDPSILLQWLAVRDPEE